MKFITRFMSIQSRLWMQIGLGMTVFAAFVAYFNAVSYAKMPTRLSVSGSLMKVKAKL